MIEEVTSKANSVVTRNLEPWGIYIGNKRVGMRDSKGVLENYERFNIAIPETRMGNLFSQK